MAYTQVNGITTDWTLHDDSWKPGTDRNWKVTDFFLIPWVKKQIATTGDLPVSPANGDAYLIDGDEIHRWNSNTASYDIFPLTGAFIFYDQFFDTYYTWTFGVIEPRDNTVLTTDGDILYFDSVLKRLPAGNDYDVVQYVGGLPTTARLPLYDLNIPRPSFQRHVSDDTKITFTASTANPIKIKVGDIFYTSSTDKTLNFAVNGRNGLVTGSLGVSTVYYIYGIAPVSGSNFDVIADVNPPTVGPDAFTGFDPLDGYTYLGSISSSSASAFDWFTYSDGIYSNMGLDSFNVSSSTVAAFVLSNVSEVAKEIKFRGLWSVLDSPGNNLSMGPSSSDTNTVMSGGDTAVNSAVCFFWIPVQESQTVYALTTHNSDSINVYLWGWRERPEDFR